MQVKPVGHLVFFPAQIQTQVRAPPPVAKLSER